MNANKGKGEAKAIAAEKINIVEQDGTIRMTLFNSENMPSLIMGGEDILPGHRQDGYAAGIMFYNGEGDECGGLIFGSKRGEKGEYESGLSLTFDQYKQDQVVQVLLNESNGKKGYGFYIYDRPDEPIKESLAKGERIEKMADGPGKTEAWQRLMEANPLRAFMGKSQDGEVSVQLRDSKGKKRISMGVDANDVPKIEFFDAEGNVIYSIPPTKEEK